MSRRKFDLHTDEDRERFVKVCQAIESARINLDDPKVTQQSVTSALAGTGISLHRANLGMWLKRLNIACGEYRDALKDAFYPFTAGWQISPAARAYWRLWEQQQDEETRLRTLLASPEKAEAFRAPYVTVSAGESVKSYLLPHVARALQKRHEPIEMRLAEFAPRTSIAALEAGHVDAVLAWDLSGKVGTFLNAIPVPGTECQPVAAVSPTHPLVQGGAKQLGVKAARRYPLVHPDIPALNALVKTLARDEDVPTSALPLPSIGYYLLTTTAVGLIPGWPWVTRDLERRFGVRCLPLAGDALREWGADTGLHLVTRNRAGDATTALRDAVSQAVNALRVPVWQEVAVALSAESATGRWHFYYITFGPNADDPKASWCKSTLTLRPHQDGGPRLVGELPLGPPFGELDWALDAEAEVVPWGHGTLILRSYRRGDREPGVSQFSKWLQPAGETEPILVGINTCVNIRGRLTAAPAVLSRSELREDVREAFLQQDAVALLAPDLANEPVVSRTVDYRPKL